MLCLAANQAIAHDLGVAQLSLRAEGETAIHLTAKLSTKVDATPPRLPDGCAIEEQVTRVTSRVTQVLEYLIRCDRAISGSIRLSWNREGALARIHPASGEEHSRYLAARNGDIDLDLAKLLGHPRTALQAMRDYLLLGTEHILLGVDHLAFVLGLCLIARGKHLLILVTGFTLGHSLTLALATLGWAQVPSLPVEACIALSIAFVARQAMLPDDRIRHGFWLVAAFGLLHGLGFAGALAETGIGQGQLVPALIAFNLGVELGQLLFVVGVLTLIWAMRTLGHRLTYARQATAFGLGSLALFWTWERLAPLVIGTSGAG